MIVEWPNPPEPTIALSLTRRGIFMHTPQRFSGGPCLNLTIHVLNFPHFFEWSGNWRAGIRDQLSLGKEFVGQAKRQRAGRAGFALS